MKGPWEITGSIGHLSWGNSMEFWRGNELRKGLAAGLFTRRLDALKAALNGEFKQDMAKEATYEAT